MDSSALLPDAENSRVLSCLTAAEILDDFLTTKQFVFLKLNGSLHEPAWFAF